MSLNNTENKRIPPLKAIKLKCKVDCSNNDRKSWIECENTDCYLYPYRLGKNPYLKGRGNLKGNPNSLRAYRKKLTGNTQ